MNQYNLNKRMMDMARVDWHDVHRQVIAKYITCPGDRNGWLAVAASLVACSMDGGDEDECREIFLTLSRQSPGYKNDRDCLMAWRSVGGDNSGKQAKATPGTFVNLFKQQGGEFSLLQEPATVPVRAEAGTGHQQAASIVTEPVGRLERQTSPDALHTSPLLQYFRNVMWGSEAYYNIAQAWKDYRVGFDTYGRAEVFRYYDMDGVLRYIKFVPFQSGTHHRDKERKMWSEGRVSCFFGEHLLGGNSDKPVGIVESEKTALVMAACKPEIVWLATSGCSNLRALGARSAIHGRDVMVYPDLDQLDSWGSIAASAGWRCAAEAVPGYVESLRAIGEKSDIADYMFVRYERRMLSPKVQEARAMAKDIPGLWQLMKEFGCSVVE